MHQSQFIFLIFRLSLPGFHVMFQEENPLTAVAEATFPGFRKGKKRKELPGVIPEASLHSLSSLQFQMFLQIETKNFFSPQIC